MRLRLRWIGLFASTASSVAFGCPTDTRTAAGVLGVEHRWVAALDNRDTVGLQCILDPSFEDTSWRGELIGKQAMLDHLQTRGESTLRLSDLKVDLRGTMAVVRGLNTQSQGAKVIGSVRFTDLFVYAGNRWRAVSAQESLVQPATPR